MTTLAAVIILDVAAHLPAAGIPGRLFFASDTGVVLYDTGTAWATFSISYTGPSLTTVAGSTSGHAVFSQPFSAAGYKKVAILMLALVGTAGYTFPTAFLETPDTFGGASASGTTVTALSTTAVTVTGVGGNGVIVLEGY